MEAVKENRKVRQKYTAQTLYDTMHVSHTGYRYRNQGLAVTCDWLHLLRNDRGVVHDPWTDTPISVVELGCGNGKLCNFLRSLNLDVTGTDIFDNKAVYDRSWYKFVKHDLSKAPYPFKNNQFDYCLSFDVLEHLKEEYIAPALQEMARISCNGIIVKVSCTGDAPLHLTIKSPSWWLKQLMDNCPDFSWSLIRNFERIAKRDGPMMRSESVFNDVRHITYGYVQTYAPLFVGESGVVGEYPLGLGYLKSNCVGADIDIVKSREELKDCDLIGLSTTAGGIKESVEILESTNIPVMVGGQGTMWDGLNDYPFEHIIHGEGETALLWIITGRAKGIKNIRFANRQNLDSLCFPDRGRCGLEVPILTSRGCPWNCHFCSSQNYWGKTRWHSAEYFLDEVDFIKSRYPKSRVLYIMDDLFIVNQKRFNDIYDKWMSDGLNKRFELKGFVRSKSMTIHKATMMKDMGFQRVRFGAESGSNRMLKLINKQETVEDHQRCVDICKQVGLNVCASLIQYLPGETVEDRQLTAEFRKKNSKTLCISGNYKFQPFPGTKFYNGESPLEGDWRTRGGNFNKQKQAEGKAK